MFIQNVGQFDDRVLFRAATGDGIFYFMEDGIWLTVLEPLSQTSPITTELQISDLPQRGVHLKLEFADGNLSGGIEGVTPVDTKVSYFIGNDPNKWYVDVPIFTGVRYEDVYPGIDIEFLNQDGRLSSRILAQPLADLSQVELAVAGAISQELVDNTKIRLNTEVGSVDIPLFTVVDAKPTSLPKPSIHQQNIRHPFAVAYQNQVASTTTLVYSTFLGSDTQFFKKAIAVNSAGEAYVAGAALSASIPTTPGAFQEDPPSDWNGFIARFNSTGSDLVYATYLGGDAVDNIRSLTVDNSGAVHVTGHTFSIDFPFTSGAYDTEHNGDSDVFVTKLNAAGNALVFSTFFGGTNGEQGLNIAIDNNGAAYIVGQTKSTQAQNFPITAGAYMTTFNGGTWDGFVAKLSADGSTLNYSTYLGGNGLDCEIGGDLNECDIAVDNNGIAYLAGPTTSSNFPRTNGTTYSGFQDAFVAKLSADGSDLLFGTYLGGSSTECYTSCSIAIDAAGAIYVGGTTASFDFPYTANAFDTTYNEGWDAFIVKFSPSGSLVYATFLGDDEDDVGHDIAVSEADMVYLIGDTQSAGFPTTPSRYQDYAGNQDAFVVMLKLGDDSLTYGTFLGGMQLDRVQGLAVSSSGEIYIAGDTGSADFPITPNAYDPSYNDDPTIFVAKIGSPAPPLYPGQDWNAECPFCSVVDTQGYVNEVNPRTGNFVHTESFLNMPVAGNTLSFDLTYISAATNTYTTTVGYGWAHNYKMQLHIDDHTNLTHTVTMQAPGGSRFPFYGRGSSDPGYNKYAGVTADLERIEGATLEDREYVVTAYNQYKATFRYDGRLIKYETPDGNAISLTYADFNGQEQLYRASQGTRYLEYDYLNGRLHTVTDSANRTVILGYQGNDLSTITDPTQATTTFLYQNHLLTEIIDASNRTIKKIFYDSNQRAYRVEDGLGNAITEITFDNPVNLLTVNEDNLAATAVVTAAGTVMTYTYDTRGTLVDVRYACNDGTNGCQAGPDIQYDYNFKGNRLQDANGNPPTTIRWNPGGSNPEYVKDALENETFLHYDSFNNLTLTIDARLNPTTYTYRYTDPDDPNNPYLPTFLTGITDTLGNTYFYTPTIAGLTGPVDGLLYEEKDPNGVLTRYGYNDFGQIIQAVRGAGTSDAITTTYGYDEAGRLITTTQTSTGESHTSLNVYDDGDWLLATIANWTGNDPAGWELDCIFDPGPRQENVCTRHGYDEAGRPISTTNALGQTSLTFYDAAGRVVTSVVNYDGLTPFAALCTDFTSPDPEYNICSLVGYDGYGRVVTSTNSLGLQTVTEYDSLGRVSRTIVNWEDGDFDPLEPDRDLITAYEYDAVGNVLVVTDPMGRQSRTFYDELNRVKGTMDNWDGEAELEDCASLPRQRDSNICSQYQYDEVGNTILVTNTLTQTTRTFYNELNRVVGIIENWDGAFGLTNLEEECINLADEQPERDKNICTLYEYDPAGNNTVVINALNQATLTVYDAAARPFLTVVNWNGAPIDEAADCQFPPVLADVNVCTLTTYDGLGRRVSTTDPMGSVTEYDYDGLGRLETITHYLDGLPVTDHTEYDALGNRLSNTNAEGHTTTYAYDSLNRLVQSTTPEGVITSQAYNAASWVITSTDGLNHSTVMGYDFLGRRTSVTDPEGNITLTYYDALGNQVALVDAAGVTTTYVYDGLNRLTAVIENDLPGHNPDHETDVLTQYVYDALGNRVVITNARGFTSSYTLYDDLNRPVVVEDALSNQTHTAYNALGLRTVMTDGNTAVTEYSYDDLNRLLTASYLADEETVTYSYDALGNRLAMQDGVGTTNYTYDDLYRLITVTNPFDAEVGYRYDRVGNRTQLIYPDGKVVSYTYDDDNRLIEVEDGEEGLTSYSYDAAGRLTTTELPNGVTTFYTYDDANRLTLLRHVHTTSGSVIARYEYSLDAVGNRTAVSETLRLPSLPGGQASLPAGLVSGNDAPLTADAAVAAIQPEPITLDKERLSRPPLQGPPPPEPTLPPAWTPQPPIALGLDATPPPFDPAEIAERARNRVQSGPDGQAFLHRPGHNAHFAAGGSLAFALTLDETDALTLTLDPATALTVSLELAAASKGAFTLPIQPIPGQRQIQENTLSQPRGPWLVEQFIARDGGIEQRWLLESAPPHSGELRLVVEATTALSLTVDSEGFVFHAPTTEEGAVPVLRYGRALAIDAGGQEQWAELSFSELAPAPDGRRRYQLQMSVPAAWLATVQYPLLIDPLLSSLVRLEQNAPANEQSLPEVAYNPDQDEFLLVWQDFRNGNWDIYGQRVNGDGALLDENFIVTNADYRQSGPQVAYGSGVYLVAWRHHTDSSTISYDVYGALISGTGQILTGSLVIANDNNDREEPTAVVYNSSSSQFLVLWQDRPGDYWHAWGRHVAAGGSMGSAFQISPSANQNEAAAAGAYNADADEYLITWEGWTFANPDRRIQGQRLDGSGSLVGSVFNIGAGSGDERSSDVLYLDSLERYLVVWQDNRDNGSNSSDIYRQLVTAGGVLDGSNTAVAATAVAETLPRLAADNQTGGALVVWQQDNGSAGQDVLGHFLASNGALAGSSFAIQSESANQQAPVLAQNSQGDYLFAWQDNRHGGWDIFSRLKQAGGSWGGAGMAHPAPGDQEKPQIAYNPDDDEYLLVWQDYRSSTDWDIYGQRVAGDGSLLGANLAINTNATTHQLNPHVAYGADEYLVVWQHYTDSSNTTYDVRGRVISRTGSFVTSHFAIANATSGGNPLKETPREVVYNSSSDQFLVLWQVEVGTDNWDIWARHVSPTGSSGSYIQIATTASSEQDAAGAYNPDDDQYLVVWDTHPGQFDTLYGRRLSGSGVVTTTDVITISTQVDTGSVTELVYLAATGQYYAVWTKGNFGVQNGDIHGRAIYADATIGSVQILAAANVDERHARLTVAGSGVLVVWQKNQVSGYDLYGRALDASGVPTGDAFAIQETAGQQQHAALAYGANGRSQLAWQDDREGGWDLYTAVLDRSYQVTYIQYDYDPLYRLTRADYSGDLSAGYTYVYR